MVDLTWEQKEQVLRELFARMNGTKVKSDKDKSQMKSNMSIVRIDDRKNLENYDSNDDEDSNKLTNSKSP